MESLNRTANHRHAAETWASPLDIANALNLDLTQANRAALAALWRPFPARPGLLARLAAAIRLAVSNRGMTTGRKPREGAAY